MRPLTKATRGVIRGGSAKKVLVLAVAGVMFFSGGIIEPPIQPSDGGSGGYRTEYSYRDQEKENRERRDRDEKEEFEFVIEFLKTATNIINNQ